MRARSLLNLALLLLAAGLIAFIWLGPPSDPPPDLERLSRLEPGAVSRIRIQRSGAPPLEIRRDGSGWRLAAPVERPANPTRVAALLGLVSARVHEAFRAVGNDLAAFGLEPPVATIWFDDQEFRFGDTDALNGWRYVLFGPDVHLITDAFYHHVIATPPAFIDPAPLAGVKAPVAITDTSDPRAAGDDGRAGAWLDARATKVRDMDPGVAWEREILVVPAEGAQPIRFRAAQVEHELLLARPDWQIQYHFPTAAGAKLLGTRAGSGGA
ncbi:MAG: DUF4340 domain-containing protein [Gammaproteobacteria bacterium]|nr:DUF4340 domain-containing protein [Gammaproteobacteria bacterium]